MTVARNVRLGEFEFDLETGDLTRLESGARPRRLPPQPAKLLALLVARRGDLLTRDEIRDQIWPDVEVDFDQSLNFCVRQVRNALGDSADRPRYVETLPRRGYRLIVRPESAPSSKRGGPTGPSWVRWILAGATAIAAIGLALSLRTGDQGPIRLGIMPFRPPAKMEFPGEPSQVSMRLLGALSVDGIDRLAVIGPSTTQAYSSDLRSVSRLASELDIDYVINGRFYAAQDGPELLVELIRSRDGAHVWVRRFPAGASWPDASDQIERAIRQELGLPGI